MKLCICRKSLVRFLLSMYAAFWFGLLLIVFSYTSIAVVFQSFWIAVIDGATTTAKTEATPTKSGGDKIYTFLLLNFPIYCWTLPLHLFRWRTFCTLHTTCNVLYACSQCYVMLCYVLLFSFVLFSDEE